MLKTSHDIPPLTAKQINTHKQPTSIANNYYKMTSSGWLIIKRCNKTNLTSHTIPLQKSLDPLSRTTDSAGQTLKRQKNLMKQHVIPDTHNPNKQPDTDHFINK